MSDEDRGCGPVRSSDFAQPPPQLLAHLRIERAEGLVEEQNVGLDGHGAASADALALPARKLGRVAFLQPGELHEFQQVERLRRMSAAAAAVWRPHLQTGKRRCRAPSLWRKSA